MKLFTFTSNTYSNATCFIPSEVINLAFGGSYRKVALEDFWNELCTDNIEVQKTENFELINLEDKDFEVLGFNFFSYTLENQKLYYVTRREYKNKMVYYETKDGHKQTLTLDHPVIFNDENNIPTLILAKHITKGLHIYTYAENSMPYNFNLDEITNVEYLDNNINMVYSVETQNETLITENGIISHNCVPIQFKKS